MEGLEEEKREGVVSFLYSWTRSQRKRCFCFTPGRQFLISLDLALDLRLNFTVTACSASVKLLFRLQTLGSLEKFGVSNCSQGKSTRHPTTTVGPSSSTTLAIQSASL